MKTEQPDFLQVEGSADLVREINPGEAVLIDQNGPKTIYQKKRTGWQILHQMLCSFVTFLVLIQLIFS